MQLSKAGELLKPFPIHKEESKLDYIHHCHISLLWNIDTILEKPIKNSMVTTITRQKNTSTSQYISQYNS